MKSFVAQLGVLAACLIIVGAVSTACLAAGGYQKYEMKSGIVTYDIVMSVSGFDLKTRRIVYWDNYGTTECQEDYKEKAGEWKLEEVVFEKDNVRINYYVKQKTGARRKAVGYGIAGRYETDMTAKQKTELKYKDLDPQTICGKQCAGMFLSTPSGEVNTWGYHRVMMKYDLNNAQMNIKTVTTAVAMEENVAIPQSKFVVPDDVKLMDM